MKNNNNSDLDFLAPTLEEIDFALDNLLRLDVDECERLSMLEPEQRFVVLSEDN